MQNAAFIANLMPNLIDELQQVPAEASVPKGFFDLVAKRFGTDDGFPTPAGNGNVLDLFVDTTGTQLVPTSDLLQLIEVNDLQHFALA